MQAGDSEPEGALSLSRSPQFSGVKPVTDRCLMEVMRRRPQSGSLIRSVLLDQSVDLRLKPRDSTLATLSPVLKGLSLWKRSGGWQSSIICTPHIVPSDEMQSRRTLRLNRDR
jgi:hypothetical protein